MPLPSALAARLAKRGLIIKITSNVEDISKKNSSKNQTNSEVEEEVIAENYDDQENKGNNVNRIIIPVVNNNINKENEIEFTEEVDDEIIDITKMKYKGYPGCPNKCNVFHECTTLCKELWKNGHKEPDPKYLKRKAAMLSKYPLPSHWKEIYDPGTGRHYYWETDSDSVSWLPPSHPKAVISESAAYLREEQASGQIRKDKDTEDSNDKDNKTDYSSEEESDEELKRREEKRRRKENEEKKRSRGRIKTRENDLDPMDPAAYSDIPRGGWSEGLSKGNEAKTGADVTAAGPLYQMRPYPNPGAVLRANAKTTPKGATKHSDEEDSS